MSDGTGIRERVIAYATPGSTKPPPFDWPAAFRQAVFAVGLGCVAFGIALYVVRDDRLDGPIYAFFIALGVALVTLTLPWPGRVGRQRRPRGDA